jgi:hypothetical protein
MKEMCPCLWEVGHPSGLRDIAKQRLMTDICAGITQLCSSTALPTQAVNRSEDILIQEQ